MKETSCNMQKSILRLFSVIVTVAKAATNDV